jgi:hypothetical protein
MCTKSGRPVSGVTRVHPDWVQVTAAVALTQPMHYNEFPYDVFYVGHTYKIKLFTPFRDSRGGRCEIAR